MDEFPFGKISRLYHEDAGFRAAADRDARAALAERGVHFDGPGEVRLTANSEGDDLRRAPARSELGHTGQRAGRRRRRQAWRLWSAWHSAGGRYDSSH